MIWPLIRWPLLLIVIVFIVPWVWCSLLAFVSQGKEKRKLRRTTINICQLLNCLAPTVCFTLLGFSCLSVCLLWMNWIGLMWHLTPFPHLLLPPIIVTASSHCYEQLVVFFKALEFFMLLSDTHPWRFCCFSFHFIFFSIDINSSGFATDLLMFKQFKFVF